MKQIAFICDIHLDEKNPIVYGVDSKKNWERILEDVRNRNINDIIFGGDIGAASAHDWFFDTLKRFKLKLILGNHDSYSEVSKYYKKGESQTALFYADKEEHLKHIFLDTSTKIITQEQLDWLANEIKTELTVVIFVHHPILKVNTPIDQKHPLLNRDDVLEVLLQSKNSIIIFCGHYHMNDEKQFGNIRQIITQSSSFQVEKKADTIVVDASEFGYRIITFNEGIIDTSNVSFLTGS